MNTYLYFTGGLERNSRNLYFVDPLWHLRKMLNDVADSVLRRERQRRELFGFIYKRQNLLSWAPTDPLVAPSVCRALSALSSPHRRIHARFPSPKPAFIERNDLAHSSTLAAASAGDASQHTIRTVQVACPSRGAGRVLERRRGGKPYATWHPSNETEGPCVSVGGRRVSPLSRRDGHIGYELQALSLWLPGGLAAAFYEAQYPCESPRYVASAGTTLKRT